MVAWPPEYGGPGWDATQRHIWEEECAAAGTPMVLPFGVAMVAPVIYTFGTPEQKERFLPGIRAGEARKLRWRDVSSTRTLTPE